MPVVVLTALAVAGRLVFAPVPATYAAGLVNNVASAIGTVAFLVPIAHSWPRMFGRIKERYQIG